MIRRLRAASRTLPAISAGEPTITPANVQFGDLNGDGLADALAVNSSGMIEFRGKGDGTFERIGPVSYPWTGTTDTTQVRLADLDRDGLLDIVRIGTSQVFWYRGKPDGTFNVQARVLDRPAGADASTVVQLADANGNGSTDVVWSSPSGMWALDLAGPTNAGLLVGIDNGLGKTQRFAYTASTQLAWAAEAAGTPWSTRMPVSIAVTTTATHVLASGEPDRTSLLDVRDGIYEADERRFIGFAQSIQTLPGSAAADTIRIVTQFHPGHGADRVLRGQPLSIRTEDGTGRVFRQVDNQCSALPVVGLPDDPRLKRAAVTQTQITTSEPGETPAVVRTRFAFDPEVRSYETRRDGRIVDGVALDGDESITRRTFTSEDPTTGVRDLVCEEDLLDGAGTVVSQVQRRFGDATSVADPCHPGRGWVREELGYLAEETRWVSTRQTAYDSDGNPTLIVADGVARALGYDSHGLHPTSETVSPADGQTLVWTAQWDDVSGTLTRVDSAAGTSARMTYDGLGRLLSIAAGDALPHVYYRYQWESPRPRTETFTFDGEPSALGALPGVWTPTAGWRHAVTISNSASEQLVTAVQLDTNQWNVTELRARDHRGRVTAVTSAFAFAGSDPGVATAPSDAATQTMAYDPLDRITDQRLATGAHKRSTYHPLGVTIAGFAYDGAGRQVQHADKQLTYDALSKLVRVDGVAGGSIEHRYGYDGGRVWTRSAAGAMTYWITPNVVVRGNERDHYVRAGERVVAKITTTTSSVAAVAVGAAGMTGTRPGLAGLLVLWSLAIAGMMWRQRGQRRVKKLRAVGAATVVPLVAMISCASPFASQTSALAAAPRLYYHQTYGAGPELTTDGAGQLVEDRRSEPFGAAIDAFRGGAVQAIDYQANPLNALNKFTDPDTRWSYHGARWLAPDTAQWHTPDPPATAPDPKFMQSPWGLNPYQYVNQNPVAYWDPDGKCSAPILGPGQVGICIEAYISAPRVGIGNMGVGDDRGPDAYNFLETNRMQQQITFDLQKHTVTNQTQLAMSEVVPPDFGIDSGFVVVLDRLALQGTGGTNVRDVWRDFQGGTVFKAGGRGLNGFADIPGGPKAPIDYTFNFRVGDDGSVSLVGGGHKGYPSYSVYSYKADGDGNVTATPLLETKENVIEDLSAPFNGLENNLPDYGPIQTFYDGGGGDGGGGGE